MAGKLGVGVDNMRRYKLRTALVFIAVVLMVASMTTLTYLAIMAFLGTNGATNRGGGYGFFDYSASERIYGLWQMPATIWFPTALMFIIVVVITLTNRIRAKPLVCSGNYDGS